MLDFREQTGGFTLLRIEKSEPHSLIALVQEKASDTVARFEMFVSSAEPPNHCQDRMCSLRCAHRSGEGRWATAKTSTAAIQKN